MKDELGVHARPAGLLVKLAKKYASKVTIEKDGKTSDMRKLMEVMGLGIKQGETITVTVEGEDETVAAEEIAAFLNENV
ncbi:HPr family phosphocarrier protein [Faecalibacterium sp. OM04-11BH]|nr:HPr family phosphocarrier protein [Faecalibacterium sp. OM04-11BH]